MDAVKVVTDLMEQMAYDPENPPQYKSPDSDNVYTVIARRVVGEDIQEIGMHLSVVGGTLQIRFCVFSATQPVLKQFEFRYSSKVYASVPVSAESKQRTGCSLNLVTVPVCVGKGISREQVMAYLEADDGWDKLSAWLTDLLNKEGFQVLPDPKQFVFLWPALLSVEPSSVVVNIVYPGPLVKQKTKVSFTTAEDFEEGDDD